MTDWAGIRTWLLSGLGEVANASFPDVRALEALVEFHGWSYFGEIIDRVRVDRDLDMMVELGVPFHEATKLSSFKETSRKEPDV